MVGVAGSRELRTRYQTLIDNLGTTIETMRAKHEQLITDLPTESNTATKSVLKIVDLNKKAHNVEVACTVTYSGLTSTATIAQYVRLVKIDKPSYYTDKIYGRLTGDVRLTCLIYGDPVKDNLVTWATDNGDIDVNDNTDNKVITSVQYDSDKHITTVELAISSLVEADELTYTCKGQYGEDDTEFSASHLLTLLSKYDLAHVILETVFLNSHFWLKAKLS